MLMDPAEDLLVVEEPLEIRLGFGAFGDFGGLEDRRRIPLAVTMRTPGHDLELVKGFLLGEGIVRKPEELLSVKPCVEGVEDADARGNVVRAELQPDVDFDPAGMERNFVGTASCGICGKASLEAVRRLLPEGRRVPSVALEMSVVSGLPRRLREAQVVFRRTGGCHAAGLFALEGDDEAPGIVREDIGRHNAVDKVIGAVWGSGGLFGDRVLVVSGRAGFELVQKAVVAGIPAMVSVGAPSSLAVELAREHGLVLIGFAKADRFNVYTGQDRIQ